MEIAGSLTCDVRLEYSYLVSFRPSRDSASENVTLVQVDATKNLVDWIHKERFSYVEMNTYPRPIQANHVSYSSLYCYNVKQCS